LILKLLGGITTPLLKLLLIKIVIKVNKNDIDLCNYNLPERDEFVTKVIRVMIKFNNIRPIDFLLSKQFQITFITLTGKNYQLARNLLLATPQHARP
jgi:hypothetical protein